MFLIIRKPFNLSGIVSFEYIISPDTQLDAKSYKTSWFPAKLSFVGRGGATE